MPLSMLPLRPIPCITGLCFFLASYTVGAQDTRSNAHYLFLNQNEALQLTQNGNILPLEKVLERAHMALSDKMLEASLKRCHLRYVYLLEILDAKDQVHDVLIDAATGELIRQ